MYFLYHSTTRPTGRPIAKALQLRCGLDFGRCRPDTQILIRWGNSSDVPPGIDPRLVLNRPEAIRKAANKMKAFAIWGDADAESPVKSVEVTYNRDTANTWLAQGSVILGRTASGTRGSGITVYGNEGNLTRLGDHSFYSKYIPDTREYRLHVVGDKVIRVQRKYLEHPELVRNPYVKNVDEGYVYKTPQMQLHSSRSKLAINAVKSLGLDFGAVDMVIDRAGIAYVLEVNSAPACSPLTGAAYVAALANMIYERTERVIDLPPALGELEALRND